MEHAVGSRGHVAAAATFYGLVALSVGLLTALAGLVLYYTPVLDACVSAWDNVVRWAAAPGMLLPLAVVVSIVVVAGLTLVRQWRATQRVLRRLIPYRVPAPARLARIAREVGLEGRLDCISQGAALPFCYGFIRPRVYFPLALVGVLSDPELRAVLRHECYHAQSRDPLKVWLSRALARGLYFLPVAGDLRDSYLAAKEIAADEVTANVDELPLASALLKLVSAGEQGAMVDGLAAVSAEPVGGHAFAGLISVRRVPSGDAEARIRRLVDGQPAQLRLPSITSVFLSAVIVVAIFAASYANLSAASTVPITRECAAESLHLGRDIVAAPPVQVAQSTIAAAERVAVRHRSATSVEYGVTQPGATTAGQLSCDLLTPSCARSRQPVISRQMPHPGSTDH